MPNKDVTKVTFVGKDHIEGEINKAKLQSKQIPEEIANKLGGRTKFKANLPPVEDRGLLEELQKNQVDYTSEGRTKRRLGAGGGLSLADPDSAWESFSSSFCRAFAIRWAAAS